MTDDTKRAIPKPPPFKIRKGSAAATAPVEQEAMPAADVLPVTDDNDIIETPPLEKETVPGFANVDTMDDLMAEIAHVAAEQDKEDSILPPLVKPDLDPIKENGDVPSEVTRKTQLPSQQEELSAVSDLIEEAPPEQVDSPLTYIPAVDLTAPREIPEMTFKKESIEDLENAFDEIQLYKEEVPSYVPEIYPIQETEEEKKEKETDLEIQYIPSILKEEDDEPTGEEKASFALPIKIRDDISHEESIEFKAGDGTKVFYGNNDSRILLSIPDTGQEWRLFVNSVEERHIPAKGGEIYKIPQEFDFAEGLVYNSATGAILKAAAGDAFTFQKKDENWNLSLMTLKELPLKSSNSIALNGKNGILIGPKSSSLVFYNVKTLDISRRMHGDYRPADYYETPEIGEEEKKSFVFSVYHENTFFEGDEETRTICLECEDNDTYGWNIKFANGLFMSIADLVEYQNRNHSLPDDKGILYHGANRLEFSNVREIVVYRKPFYYGYGVG